MRKTREKLKESKEETRATGRTFGPKRKLKACVSERQFRRRKKAAEKDAAKLVGAVASSWDLELGSCGVMHTSSNSDNLCTVKLRKGDPNRSKVEHWLHLHDSGLSKKKLHETRMLSSRTEIPSLHAVNKAQKEAFNEQLDRELDIQITDNAFIIDPESIIKKVIKFRGLEGEETLDIMLEGDGRGTGKSFKSVIFQCRFLNEGRLIFREDRQCPIALIVGDESHSMMADTLKEVREKLKRIQEDGLVLEGKHFKVNMRHNIDLFGHFLFYSCEHLAHLESDIHMSTRVFVGSAALHWRWQVSKNLLRKPGMFCKGMQLPQVSRPH